MAKKYQVNWKLQGVGKKDLNEGDIVSLEADDAAPLLKLGVITDPKAGESPEAEESAEAGEGGKAS